MKVNLVKLLAAVLIISGSIVLYANDLEFTIWVLVLKVLGAGLFLFSISSEMKRKRKS